MPGQPLIGGGLKRDTWVKSVVQGADERSPRWRHCLLIAGLLLGYGDDAGETLSRSLRSTLNTAFVDALNLALVEARHGDELGASAVTLVLNYVFPLLKNHERSRIDYDVSSLEWRYTVCLLHADAVADTRWVCFLFIRSLSLGVLLGQHRPRRTTDLKGEVQLASGSYIHTVVCINAKRQQDRSPSFVQLNNISSQPLITGMGPLSRLISHTVEHCNDSFLIQAVMDDILRFSQTIMTQWRQIKLSEVDLSEETLYFDSITLTMTLPLLWKVLRSALFVVVVVLRGCMTRCVSDGNLAHDEGK